MKNNLSSYYVTPDGILCATFSECEEYLVVLIVRGVINERSFYVKTVTHEK